MKGMKKISLLALGLAFVGVASGVKAFADTDYVEFDDLETEIGEISTLEQPESFPDIYINEDNKMQYHLEGISVNTDNARTTFYLGEEFSADGLLVLADFIKLDENGNPAKDENGRTISVTARVTNYQVDSSNIDTSIMDRYKAQVSYRYGDTVKTAEYIVRVESSEFETTRNLVYMAGIKAGYKSDFATNSNGLNRLKNNGRILTTYLRYNTTTKENFNDFGLNPSDLNIQLIKHTVNRVATAFETEYIDIDTATLTDDETNKKLHNDDNTLVIDYSGVNVGKVGSYLIPISYNAGVIQVNGRSVDNIVESFIVVDVISPISQVINTNSSYEIEASMDLPDFSDYTVSFRRKIWTGTAFGNYLERNIPMTNDLFRYENLISYNQGVQPTTFVLKEQLEDADGNPATYTLTKDVTVTASTLYDIYVTKDMTGKTGIIKTNDDPDDKRVYYESYDLGNGVIAYNILSTDSKGNDTLGNKPRICNQDGLSFAGFAKLDTFGKGSYFEFTFTKTTKLILYIGSGDTDERGFCIYDSNDEVVYEDTVIPTDCINDKSTSGKESPMRFVVDLPAGTYRVSAKSTTVTFHGYIIGTSKEAE